MKTKTNLATATAFAALLATAMHTHAQPVITREPAGTNAYVNTTVRFTVTATGSPGLVYQWQFNGTDLLDRTNANLSLANVKFTDAGSYSVMVRNAGGSVTSHVARLSVLPTNVVSLGDHELKFGQLSVPIWAAPRTNDSAQTLSGDGLTLFYSSYAPGGSGGLDMWMITRPTRTSTNWSTPVNLGPTLNSPNDEGGLKLLPGGLSLYFTSNRTGGRGGWDIWVATRPSLSDPFGSPVNLGPAINGNSDETDQQISADNRTLVFTSSRLGPNEVWMSTRTNAAAPWGSAIHLPVPINNNNDTFPVELSRDGLLLFLKSWRPNSLGPEPARIYVCRRVSPTQPFGPPVLIQPILGIGTGGADYCSLSDDGTTLYVGTYRTLFPDWPQVVQLSVTALPQLTARGRNALGEFQFDLLGREGATYEIESSTNLSTWTLWLTTNTTASVKLSAPAPEGRRFYRALNR